MAETQVPTIIDQLQTEEESLLAAAESLRVQLSLAENQLERVRTAREALQPKERLRRAGTKKAPTRDDVKNAIAVVLKQHGKQPLEVLRQQVEDYLVASGFSKVGYSLRFKEAIAELGVVKQPTDQQPTPNREEGR